jgi:hypothetical protein
VYKSWRRGEGRPEPEFQCFPHSSNPSPKQWTTLHSSGCVKREPPVGPVSLPRIYPCAIPRIGVTDLFADVLIVIKAVPYSLTRKHSKPEPAGTGTGFLRTPNAHELIRR